MNCFAKPPNEFAHHNFIKKAGLKHNPSDHPYEKNCERRDPRPPAGPGGGKE